MKYRLLLCLALTLVPACGGSSDPKELTDQGSTSLGAGKNAEAAKSFEQALAAMGDDSANPDWMRAKMGLIQAEVPLDAKKAKDLFLALHAAQPSKLGPREFSLIGSKLAEAGKLAEATEILEAGMQAHAESPQLLELRGKLGDLAKASGSQEDLEALKGLGYAGD